MATVAILPRTLLVRMCKLCSRTAPRNFRQHPAVRPKRELKSTILKENRRFLDDLDYKMDVIDEKVDELVRRFDSLVTRLDEVVERYERDTSE